MDVDNALSAFDALSQETRLWAFRILVQAGPEGLSAGEVAESLGCRQNTMSTHLKALSSRAWSPAGSLAAVGFSAQIFRLFGSWSCS